MASIDPPDRRCALPSVRALVEDEALNDVRSRVSHEALVTAARTVLDRARSDIARGNPGDVQASDVVVELSRMSRPRTRRVINATGVVLHTNLGRAPLASEAISAASEAAGYTSLELQLSTGRRGGRDDGVQDHLRALTGAEAAFAVNNCAAASLLALSALAAGREVIVSRGELVEIGGGFRVPEVLQQSGCRLVEVGTTNRTRADDFERAFTPATAAVLRVHRSNFSLLGFTEEVPLPRLAELAHRHGCQLLFDQGTGELDVVGGSLRDGADLVMFSGDKLLGGPQAGVAAGRAEPVEQARRHPLARALRIDKLRLAALEATLGLWRTGQVSSIPSARMLAEPESSVRRRAESLASLLAGEVPGEVVASSAAAGGGTRAGQTIPSWAFAVAVERPHALARLLRIGDEPVVARVSGGAVLVDLRTVPEVEVGSLAGAIRAASAAYQAGPVAAEEDAHDDDETMR